MGSWLPIDAGYDKEKLDSPTWTKKRNRTRRKMMPHPAPEAGIHSGHCLLSGARSPGPQESISDSDYLKHRHQKRSPEQTLPTATLTYTINYP